MHLQHGLSACASKELFLLAQLSEQGYQESNSIIAKLLKKKADSETIANVSAFVHRCVVNARTSLGNWSYDKGGAKGGKGSKIGKRDKGAKGGKGGKGGKKAGKASEGL